MARARAGERPVVSLVPHSGIQFLDLEIDIDALPKTTRSFWEERIAASPIPREDAGAAARPPVRRGRRTRSSTRSPASTRRRTRSTSSTASAGSSPISTNGSRSPSSASARAARTAPPIYDQGPSNWARVRVTEVKERGPGRAEPPRDARLRHGAPPARGGPSLRRALDPGQRRGAGVRLRRRRAAQRLVPQRGLGRPVARRAAARDAAGAARRAARCAPEDFPHTGEHWARYLTFLGLLADAGDPAADQADRHRLAAPPLRADRCRPGARRRQLADLRHPRRVQSRRAAQLQRQLRPAAARPLAPRRALRAPVRIEGRVRPRELRQGRRVAPVGARQRLPLAEPGARRPRGGAARDRGARQRGDDRALEPEAVSLGRAARQPGLALQRASPATASPPSRRSPARSWPTSPRRATCCARRGAGQPAVRPRFSRSAMYTLLARRDPDAGDRPDQRAGEPRQPPPCRGAAPAAPRHPDDAAGDAARRAADHAPAHRGGDQADLGPARLVGERAARAARAARHAQPRRGDGDAARLPLHRGDATLPRRHRGVLRR